VNREGRLTEISEAAVLARRLDIKLRSSSVEPERKPVKITRKMVQEAADQLASDAWGRREIPGELERTREIRLLADQQLKDDVLSTAGRHRDQIGRAQTGRVLHRQMEHDRGDEMDLSRSLWPARTPDQLALEAAMMPFLDGLPGEQKMMVEWHFGPQMMTQHEIAEKLPLSQPTIHRRIKDALSNLKQVLTVAFLDEENK